MRLGRWFIVLGALAFLVFASDILLVVFAGDGLGLLEERGDNAVTYFLIFALIFGDAIIPLLPGETTLNTAAVMAANGELDLGLVMLAGALGAVLGDNALYWIARLAGGRYESQVERAKQDVRVQRALEILGDRAAILIVFGRYVPGLRFVVNATMGLNRYPYRSFLLWSTIGGVTWAVYTAFLAYQVGTAMEDYPLLSILASGAITTVLLGVIYLAVRNRDATRTTTASPGAAD